MNGFIRLGDKTSHGGEVITASSTTQVGGITVALVGDLVSCPKTGHGITPILPGNTRINISGKQVALEGFSAGCGCTLIASQCNTSSAG